MMLVLIARVSAVVLLSYHRAGRAHHGGRVRQVAGEISIPPLAERQPGAAGSAPVRGCGSGCSTLD